MKHKHRKNVLSFGVYKCETQLKHNKKSFFHLQSVNEKYKYTAYPLSKSLIGGKALLCLYGVSEALPKVRALSVFLVDSMFGFTLRHEITPKKFLRVLRRV